MQTQQEEYLKEFPKEFVVTKHSKIEKRNIPNKIRTIHAYFHPPEIQSRGETGIYYLQNIRLSPCENFIEEDVSKASDPLNQLGIARTELMKKEKYKLYVPDFKRDLLNHHFRKELPGKFHLIKDYDK